MSLNNNSFIWLTRGLIRVSGPDRAEFLQGLVSNDMAALRPDNALYACVLTPQGKFLHDFFVIDDGESFLIDCEPGDRRDDLIQRLRVYKLRRKVEITLIDNRAVIVGLSSAPAFENAKIYTDPRHPDMGWRAIVKSEESKPPRRQDAKIEPQDSDAARSAIKFCDCSFAAFESTDALASLRLGGSNLPGNELSFDDWDYRRISLTIPDGSRDAEVGVSTLEELNIPRLNGVSFTKGCYVGQELTARMQNRNLGKRHLKTVKLNALPEGAELRSSCRDIGLALIKEK